MALETMRISPRAKGRLVLVVGPLRAPRPRPHGRDQLRGRDVCEVAARRCQRGVLELGLNQDDAGAELQQAQAQRAGPGRGERRVGQHAEPEEVQEVVYQRMQQEADGVRAEGVAGTAIGRELALELDSLRSRGGPLRTR